MYWIDPNCLPETRVAVEGFIVNRHSEIDGLLLTGECSTSLLVCMPPHPAAAIRTGTEDARTIAEWLRPGASVAVRGGGLSTKHGRVITAVAIGPKRHAMRSLATGHKDHRDKEPKHKHEREKRHDARTFAGGRG